MRRVRFPEAPTLASVGGWYTIGVTLGLGVGLGVILSGLLAANTVGVGAAVVVGAAAGAAIGYLIGDTPEILVGALGGLLGALSAAAVVVGALRRGATRFGVAAYLGAVGVLLLLVALVPIAGYAAAVVLPVLAARLRGREAARFAGLRTLAK
jgi:hypothetical protein